jgi:hypothetical protein
LKQQNKKQELGRNWVANFIKLHPELKSKPGRCQEAKRFNSFTPKAVLGTLISGKRSMGGSRQKTP